MDSIMDKRVLIELAHYKMPFGKHKDAYLIDLPEPYLAWFKRQGFPQGKLGRMLESTLEIKTNGLAPLIRKIREDFPRESP
ncbi:MAG: DUF3820 family protein [Bacteroidota bacterium]